MMLPAALFPSWEVHLEVGNAVFQLLLTMGYPFLPGGPLCCRLFLKRARWWRSWSELMRGIVPYPAAMRSLCSDFELPAKRPNALSGQAEHDSHIIKRVLLPANDLAERRLELWMLAPVNFAVMAVLLCGVHTRRDASAIPLQTEAKVIGVIRRSYHETQDLTTPLTLLTLRL
jgi:hypothetical protein